VKTNQVMIRQMGVFQVEQRTKDGFFDGASLLRQWNGVDGNPRRRMSEFLESPKVKYFMDALAEDESHRRKTDIAVNQLLTARKGKLTKNGRTPDKMWFNPILFIKFAMWINPRFEVQVIRFVYDRMIEFRNEAGDAYKELASAVQKIVQPNFMKVAMKKVGEALNWIIFNRHEKALRNKHGDEKQMQSLFDLERETAMLINKGFVKDFKSLVTYLRDEYKRRNTPSVFLPENIKEAIA
jgi:hypothetical protein